MSVLSAIYVMDPREWRKIYSSEVADQLAQMVQILGPVMSSEDVLRHPELLSQTDVLLSGWGGPALDENLMAMMPRLKAVLYGAGSARYMLSSAFWERNIPLSTANGVNAIPVAEYTLAHILLGLKSYWSSVRVTRSRRRFQGSQQPAAGAYNSKVGLLSLSTIGRMVRRRLEPFELSVLAYDPLVDSMEASRLDVEMVALTELFSESDVVSVHAPLLDETVGLVTGQLIASMKPGATFINTSRGGIVREEEMIEVLKFRTDLTAILDVTDPEPPSADCELFDLPNVLVSPHIAGSLDGECGRMGNWVVEELRRFLRGDPLRGAILENKLKVTA